MTAKTVTGRPRGRPPKLPAVGRGPHDGTAPTEPFPAERFPSGGVLELLPEPDRDDAPDVQAAVASLTPEPEPAAPGAAPAPAPGGGTAPPALSGVVQGSAAPALGAWTDRRIGRAKRRDLAAKVRELQGELATLQPAGGSFADGAGLPGQSPVEELDELFALVLPAISALLEYAVGPEMHLDATECRVLAKTGAPAALPYYAKARTAAPVTPFLLAVAAVFGPKLVDVAKARAKIKAGQPAAVPDARARYAPDAFTGPTV